MHRIFTVLSLSFHAILAQQTDISSKLNQEIEQIATQGHINGIHRHLEKNG